MIRQMSQAGKKEPMMSKDGARLQPDRSDGSNAISKKSRANVIARGMRRPDMLHVWNCLQINRPNTATVTVVETHLHFPSERIPYAPNDRLPAATFEIAGSSPSSQEDCGPVAGGFRYLTSSPTRLWRRVLSVCWDRLWGT